MVTPYRSDELHFILQRYFGRRFLKHGAAFLGIPITTLKSYANGTQPVPLRVWLQLPFYAPKAKESLRSWAKNRKERIDTWLENREAYVDNTVLAMQAYAEEGRRARAARKGNQHPGGQ